MSNIRAAFARRLSGAAVGLGDAVGDGLGLGVPEGDGDRVGRAVGVGLAGTAGAQAATSAPPTVIEAPRNRRRVSNGKRGGSVDCEVVDALVAAGLLLLDLHQQVIEQ